MISDIDPQIGRSALCKLPAGASHGERTQAQEVYLPRSHLKALDPDALLVTGMRGAGKTFWWSALQDGEVRQLVAQSERTKLSENTVVRVGFGVRSAPDEYPGVEALRSLRAIRAPRDIWRTVLAWQLTKDTEHRLADLATWEKRAEFVAGNAEEIDRFLQERDDEYGWKGVLFLLLFDGLDRCAEDWAGTTEMVRALLQVALEVRSYRHLRVKVFLRSDRATDRAIATFPDASKVLTTQVELTWPSRELYGLLWHHLANKGKYDNVFRQYLAGKWRSVVTRNHTVWPVPRPLVLDEDAQRRKFHGLAGTRMGGRSWRAQPYSWIQDNLSDAHGHVSARSFLTALREAAQHTADEHPDHACCLHHESIIHGVQRASTIRIREMQEDHPWIDQAMSALRGLSVPVPFYECVERWREERVVERLSKDGQLGPRHLGDGAEDIRNDLETLGVFQRLRDERVNIPNVYRVGYGMGRRGGVQPVR